MNKAGIQKERTAGIVVLTVACFFLFLMTGCGLDTYPVLFAPYSDGHTAYYDSDDFTQRYFSLRTNDSENSSSSVKFKGTEIYYKIFNNYSTMVSYQSAVSTLNTDSNYTAAAEKMIDTQGYKTLKLSTGSITPLVKATGDNRYVYIRLTDYGTSEAYSQGICLAGEVLKTFSLADALTYNGTAVYPRRSINQKYTFNFGGNNTDTDLVPIKTDEDVCWTDTTTKEKTWYVDLYAVSVGIDTSTWTTYYSPVLHLGSTSIVEGEDN